MSAACTVELCAVAKRFGARTAIEGLSAVFGAGAVAVLGPNGSGKSTLLRLLATVTAPDEGRVVVDGLDAARPDDRLAIRRRLGYLPQECDLYGGFTAFELVDYVAILKELTDRRARRDEVRRVLHLMGLDAELHRKLRKLSAGTRRRVALAAALLATPSLLILDEPTTGLDPEQRSKLRAVLADHAARGPVFVSTHHGEDIADLCRRVLVLDGGRVRFDGTPAALAAVAAGRVWIGPPCAGTLRTRVDGWGCTRNVGDPPAGAPIVAPTLDDGYLLLAALASTGDRGAR